MLDIESFFAGILLSLGGSIGVCFIILRSIKARVENYADAYISSYFEKEIEKYKFELEKQLSDYKNISEKYSQYQDRLIKSVELISTHLSRVEEGVRRCAEEHRTFHFIFSISNYSESLTFLREIHSNIDDRFYFEVYFPRETSSKVKSLLMQCRELVYTVDVYIKKFDFEANDYIDLTAEINRLKRTLSDVLILLSTKKNNCTAN